MPQTFGVTSTTDDVLEGVDLRDKRFLVTGVSAGLGVETARALVAHGAEVIGTARDMAKAEAATAEVRAQAAKSGGFELVELDLASLASVRACADQLLADGRRFDGVICNAGVMTFTLSKTVDGFETHFGTNHLGHFVLANRIASLINPGGRLVNVSSAGHRFSDVNLDDPNFDSTEFKPFEAYGRSKTANILFAVEFDRRHRERGIRATAVHPGGIQTELAREITPEMTQAMADAGAETPEWKTVPQGAATSIWAGLVANAETVGGRYCEDCHLAQLDDGPVILAGIRSYALDPANAQALWTKSEEMVGERF